MGTKFIFSLMSLLCLAACSNFGVPRYQPNFENVEILKKTNLKAMRVGSFQGPIEFNNQCRIQGPILLPDNLAPEAYIRKALTEELKSANIYSNDEPLTIAADVIRVDFSSAVSGGTWNIDVLFKLSSGGSFGVSERYEIGTGFNGPNACQQVASAFTPAIQNLLKSFYRALQHQTN